MSMRLHSYASNPPQYEIDTSGRYKPEHPAYDLRYSYPPPPPRDTGRPSGLPTRQRARWPPSPSVEDEAVALLKEHGTTRLQAEDVPQSRGTIDQEPLIQDVPGAVPAPSEDRRFVWVESKAGKQKDTPTPPTSDDEKDQRGRRKAPKLETGALPEMRGRQPSPYAWKPPTYPSNNRSSGEFFLSPDCLTPPPTAPSASRSKQASTSVPWPSSTDSQPNVSKKEDASAFDALRNDEDVFDNSDIDDGGAASLRTRRPPARYSFVNPEAQILTTRKATSGTASPIPDPIRKPGNTEEARAHPDFSNNSSRPEVLERARKPTPLKVSSLAQDTITSSAKQSSPNQLSGQPYRTPSQTSSSPYPPSPPRSPRLNADKARESKPPSIPNSRPGSRDTSLRSTPQTSPHLSSSLPSGDQAWNSYFASQAAQRSRPPSRLASSSTVPESCSYVPPRLREPVRHSSSLPYPVEEDVYQLMPSEKDHQFFPEQLTTVDSPAPKTLSRAGTPVSTPSERARPPFPMRHTAAEVIPLASPSAINSRKASITRPASPKTPSTSAPAPLPLPACPRPEYSRGHDDWYMLDGCAGFDICPDCVSGVFASTVYRSYFKRSPPRPSSVQTKCDFSDPWIRLAWLLTLQRQLPSLSLLKSLTNLPMNHLDQPCPGSAEEVRNWYTIRDRDGRYLRDFVVCPQDVRKLELLLPALRGLFVPLPQRNSYSYGYQGEERKCALRTTPNNRFSLYLDSLVSLHESAASARRMPDTSNFVSLVRHKSRIRECTRDDMLRGQRWHYIPSLLPAFTVCQDCFDEVVQPQLRADSDIAMRFNGEPQFVSSEGRLGSSCQLYSARMRRVFKRAVEDNDLKYLARRAKERKEVEDKLQGRVADINYMRRRLRRSDSYALSSREEAELDRLQDECEGIAEEWSAWE